jgi:hypothetical protein
MPGTARLGPAWFGRAVCLAAIFSASLFGAVPGSPPEQLSQFNRPDAAEAARILERFRQSGVLGEYYLEFELHALPRRGEARVYQGRIWGSRNAAGAINRIEVTDGSGVKHRLLVQNGAQPAVWRQEAGGVVQLGSEALFAPVIPGVDVTAFDLQRSYLAWPDATLQSTNRVLGRPAYAYLFRAPAGFSSGDTGIVAARAFFDTVFNQPLQSELLDRDGRRLKTLSVVSLKTVEVKTATGTDKQTVPKEVDFRNELTRDKTRFEVTGLALNLSFFAGVFEPARLGVDAAPPAPDRVTRLTP